MCLLFDCLRRRCRSHAAICSTGCTLPVRKRSAFMCSDVQMVVMRTRLNLRLLGCRRCNFRLAKTIIIDLDSYDIFVYLSAVLWKCRATPQGSEGRSELVCYTTYDICCAKVSSVVLYLVVWGTWNIITEFAALFQRPRTR